MIIELILTLLTLYIAWQVIKKPSSYPPGNWGLPLVGYLPLLGKQGFEERLLDLREKHGDVVSWRIGSHLVTFIFDYKLLKQAFAGHEFLDRPDIRVFSVLIAAKNMGVLAANGVQWNNGRRFALRHLRDLGMGKSRMVSAVQFEAKALVNAMRETAGKPSQLSYAINVAVLNVVWQMVASKRYGMHDEELRQFESSFKNLENNLVRLAIPDFFLWIKYVLPEFILNMITNEEVRVDMSNKLHAYLGKIIEDHKKNLNSDDPRDYVDAYLIEMEKQKDDPASTLSNEDLIVTISDLFLAGSETTTTTLKWAFLYLANFPEVQKKLQMEVDETLPNGASVIFEDKARLPYVEAFITEVLRYSAMAKFIAIHVSGNDANLGGYTIPKGSLVVGVMPSIHFDPKYFDSPKEFRPERFIDANGKFESPKDGFIPFGNGRRQCLGESLARMELFIFITTIVQCLHVAAPPGKKIDLSPRDGGFLNFTKYEEIVITER